MFTFNFNMTSNPSIYLACWYYLLSLVFCFVLDRVSRSPGWSQVCYVAKDNLEFILCLHIWNAKIKGVCQNAQFLQCWDQTKGFV